MNDTPREAAINGTNCAGRPNIDEFVLHDEDREDRSNAILPVNPPQQNDTQLHFLLPLDSVRYKNWIYDPGQVLEPVLQPMAPTGSPLGGEDFVSTGIQIIPPAQRYTRCHN